MKYVNEEAIDEEPLRLFYCEDSKIYSPIVNKDGKRIKRKTTTPPKKRPKLFDVHQHPDLEVLWKIKESSIDLNKVFSQGVLDVNISYIDKQWMENYNMVKELDVIPEYSYKTADDINLGWWCSTQRRFKKNGKLSQ